MQKRVLLLFLVLIILPAFICNLPSLVTPVADSKPTEDLLMTANIPVIEPPLLTDPTVTAVTVVQLHPRDGDLMTQINAELQKATVLGQQPIVEFDASW